MQKCFKVLAYSHSDDQKKSHNLVIKEKGRVLKITSILKIIQRIIFRKRLSIKNQKI
jgi:hypothetical protein